MVIPEIKSYIKYKKVIPPDNELYQILLSKNNITMYKNNIMMHNDLSNSRDAFIKSFVSVSKKSGFKLIHKYVYIPHVEDYDKNTKKLKGLEIIFIPRFGYKKTNKLIKYIYKNYNTNSEKMPINHLELLRAFKLELLD